MPNRLQDLLAPDKDQELLQSFIRVSLKDEEDEIEESNKRFGRHRNSAKKTDKKTNKKPDKKTDKKPDKSAAPATTKNGEKSVKFANEVQESERTEAAGKLRMNRLEAEIRAMRRKQEEQIMKKKKPKENFVDFYTDKDRAAAVSAGAFDIKQSLQIKQKQDRVETLLIPDEADISSIIALGLKEIKNANPDNALNFFSKALELNSKDINALVSRSKCYLLLGDASKALADAETALNEDKNNIRAIYQKAEALYFLGQFEQSLMFFHRGLRARPELASFRLGVQKTQEAIQNTIGSGDRANAMKPAKIKKSGNNTPKSQQTSTRPAPRQKPTRADLERRNARKLLGELCVDKEYLENLLKHPHLLRADTNTENISVHAKEAVEFLNKRQEFWRQQRPCTALPNYKNLKEGEGIPGWF